MRSKIRRFGRFYQVVSIPGYNSLADYVLGSFYLVDRPLAQEVLLHKCRPNLPLFQAANWHLLSDSLDIMLTFLTTLKQESVPTVLRLPANRADAEFPIGEREHIV